jgi:K+-sensing histidine kinase KdpD
LVGWASPFAAVARGVASIRPLVTAPLWRAPPLHGLLGAHWAALLASLAMVFTATIALIALRDVLPVVNLVTIIYLIPVVVAATLWGTRPAVIAAAAGALAADFFFYPPLYTFWIDDPQNVADLVVFLIAAVVTGNLASRLRHEADSLRRREKEIRDLYAFSRELAACFTVADLIAAIQTHLSQALGHRAFLLEPVGADPALLHGIALPDPVRRRAAAMPIDGAGETHAVADPSNGDTWLVRTLMLDTAKYVVLADLGRVSGLDAENAKRHFDAVVDDAAATLVRLEVAKAMAEAKTRLESDTLRNVLIGTVSHELRSPLASILGSTSVLDQVKAVKDDVRIRGLVAAVHREASRLDGDIRNLLSAARMTAGGVRPQREWSDPADIVNAALAQKAGRLAAHRLVVDLAANLPLIRVDSSFVEQALAQLIENAAKYSPAGSQITVSARAAEGQVVLSIADQGSGLGDDEVRQIGRRAFRGTRHLKLVPGSGLGLWLASSFVAANGGTLDAAGPGRGTTVSMRFPIERDAPADRPAAGQVAHRVRR